MTKFDGRTKDATARQINESLQRLQTDHIDLIQYHENIRKAGGTGHRRTGNEIHGGTATF
jgi:aryl-alcohol dehydrogenase-like predicted oxidoreductase